MSTAPSIWTFVIATVAGLVVAIATHFLSAHRARQESRPAAVYTALRAALELEDYALACVSVLQDFDGYDHNDPMIEGRPANLPEAPVFPADLDWRPLRPRLISAALGFPALVRRRQAHIRSAFDYDPDPGFAITRRGASELGSKAWDLAVELRTGYGLPPLDVADQGWDWVAYLKRASGSPTSKAG